MLSPCVRVLIADDDALVRSSLMELIDSRPEMELVGAAHDAEGAIELASSSHPDVAVLDYRMPGGGVHATREIRRLSPRTVVLGLSAYGDPGTKGQMIGAGAKALLVKGECTIDELVASIMAVAAAEERGSGRPAGE